MKGIILAGGYGTRLFPITQAVCKQLLPVYDKPMVYYPLATLMLAGIRDILLITAPGDLNTFRRLLGDGSQLGLTLSYQVQSEPRGLADAFLVGEKFITGDTVGLVLGDNIFYGHGLSEMLQHAGRKTNGATIFAYWVTEPQRYGVVEFAADGRPLSIEEKPAAPRSNYAVTGIYFYDAQVADLAHALKPSRRGELEITDLNRLYLERGQLEVRTLGRGIAWLDTGSPQSLVDATLFIRTIEERQGLKIACIEEIAYANGWIDRRQLLALAEPLCKSGYGEYLLKILSDG